MQAPVREIRTTAPNVLAFDVPGEVSEQDLEMMARRVDTAFETNEKVSVLLQYENYQGNELGALLDPDVVRTHFKALANLHRYAVVGAPGHMDLALKAISAVLPIEPKTFDKTQVAEAWDWVGARPEATVA